MGNVTQPIRSPKREIIDDQTMNGQPIEKRVKEEAETIASPDVIDTYVHVHVKKEIAEDDAGDLLNDSSSSASQQLHDGHSIDGGSGYASEDEEERQVMEEFLASGHSRHVDNPLYGENHTLARALAYQALLSTDYRQRYELVSAQLRSRRIFKGLPSFCGPDAPSYSIDDARPTSSHVRTFPSKPSNWPVPASTTNEENTAAEPQKGRVDASGGGVPSEQQTSELARKNQELIEEVAYWKSNAHGLLYTNRELQRRMNVLTQQLAEEASEATEERERDRERIDELIYELRMHDQYWAQQQMQKPYPEQSLQYPQQQLQYPDLAHQSPQYDQAWTQQMQKPYPDQWASTQPESYQESQGDQYWAQQQMHPLPYPQQQLPYPEQKHQVPQYDQTWAQQRGLPVFPAAMKWVKK